MKATTGAWSSPLENGIIAFLKELQPTLEAVIEEITFDYLTLDSMCRKLFMQMEQSIGVKAVEKSNPSGKWEERTTRSCHIVEAVLGDLNDAEEVQQRTGRAVVVPTLLTNKVVEVLQEYFKVEIGVVAVDGAENVENKI
jgi:hypothetical protein